RFQEIYQGKAPWDIGRPQSIFVEAADQIAGSVLDAGCGTGENALFFAARGQRVTGIDFLEQPIGEAKRKAKERGLEATFLVMDALHLDDLPEAFDSAIDCGLFHVFSDADRPRYVSSLASVVKPGGRLFLVCFSDKEPPGDGPRRVSQPELREAFSVGWLVESVREARFDVRPDLPELHFSPGGPYAWFCVFRRLHSAPRENRAGV
ncbi:MAG: SAM-dependent methyltransferase, partial [Planctomycetia bacterium 21-64-5]